MRELFEPLITIAWNVWHYPDIMDFVDILILAVVIYQMILHVRNTRVSQTLKGIVILLFLTWLSGVLGMRSVHMLLTWIINAGPVMIVVLFQSEIRRILEELGNLEPGVFNENRKSDNIIDEITLAVMNMSRRRVGALIVIENGIRLNDVIATGTHVDGLISQPLIENIFEPKTPLHDGAVILREDRVVAAACLLRLSDTTGVGRDLGTRHRAGIGMSEVSDATVLIVSEETGAVSLAEGGNLQRHLDEQAVRQVLNRVYGDQTDSRRALPLLHLRKGGHSHDDEQ
ncbi:MAG: diadenylate cyclase CdaA, partial [Clostridia bacterium]|nr:diadenylate cyclase CdaA [Clostridia bacterium]